MLRRPRSFALVLLIAASLTLPRLARAEDGASFLELKKKQQAGAEDEKKADGKKEEAKKEEAPAAEAKAPPPASEAKREEPAKKPKKKKKEVAPDSARTEAPANEEPAREKTAPAQPRDAGHGPETVSADKAFVLQAQDREGKQTLGVRGGQHCYTLEYDHAPSEVFSCREPLPVTYTELD